MIKKTKAVWLCLMVVCVLALVAGCGAEETPYDINNTDNFTFSIRYDAKGGLFTDNTPVIVDSYNLSQLPKNSQGMVELPLIPPEDESRDKDCFRATRTGYYLAGWYQQCQETVLEDGTVQYTYAQPWDFATDRVIADPNGEYSAQNPALTLYAAWVPLYQVEFYDLQSGQLIATEKLDPGAQLQMPAWDAQSGTLKMNRFPKKDGYTLEGVYLDAQGTQPVQAEALDQTLELDRQTAQVSNNTMKLYLTWREGEWYRISTAEQFADNFNLNGCYEILADLDFSEVIWPTAMMYGTYNGTILGNGHTLSNISIAQTDNSKVNAGLFGQLSQTAVLQDLTFQNVSLTIRKGARMTGTAYGLLCGVAADGATASGVSVKNSRLLIDSGCYFGTDDYSIGLVCGMGALAVDSAEITCLATGDAPETVHITVTDSMVTLEFVTE